MFHLIVDNQWPKGFETVNTIWYFDFTTLNIFLFLIALGIAPFLIFYKKGKNK